MAEVKWIKIVTDIFDDEKTVLIESIPEADSVIVIWFKLLCLAGKQNNGGVFMLNDKIAYTDEMLSTIFRRPLNTVRLALKTFEQFGMVEIVDDVYTIPNWEKHQSIEALDKMREQNRKRVAAHRARQKLLAQGNSECNITVTECNATEEEKEEEKEKEIEIDIKKENKKKKAAADVFVSFAGDNQELLNALKDFERMRKDIKKPMSDRAKTMLISSLEKVAKDAETAIAVLNQSILHCWQTVYPLKEEKKQGQSHYSCFKGREEQYNDSLYDDPAELNAECEALEAEMKRKYGKGGAV